MGGGGGVARSRRQVWTFEAANGGGRIDVILGVNGYIWISKHVDVAGDGDSSVTRTNIEEVMSKKAYSSQNDEISPETRREIARVRSVIQALVQEGVRVDEECVMKGYEAAVQVEIEQDGQGGDYLGDEKGRRVVRMVLGTA